MAEVPVVEDTGESDVQVVSTEPDIASKTTLGDSSFKEPIVRRIRSVNGDVLEGSFYDRVTYANFLDEWLRRTKKKMNVISTSFTLHKEDRNVLGFCNKQCYHSFITIVGLPPTKFFGSGLGNALRYSKWAACREVVVRLYEANLITPVLFSKIGICKPLTKTDKRKYRKQWLFVNKRATALDNMMLAEVPRWFLYGPYGENMKKEGKVVEDVEKVVDTFKNLFHDKDDLSNLEMRRKRKAEDEMEMKTLTCCRDSVVKILPSLDDEVTVYAKRRKMIPEVVIDEDCVIIDEKGNANNSETAMQESSLKVSSRTENSVGPTLSECDISKDNDCEIIGSETPVDIMDDKNNSSDVGIPSTSKEVVLHSSVTGINETTSTYEEEHLSSSSGVNLCLCEKLGVCHVSPSSRIFELIKKRRQESPNEFNAFDDHIWRHFEMNAQDDRTFTWKMQVREKLLNVVRRLYPEARLIAVGSTINGCGAYNSDMDLCMCLPHPLYGYRTDRRHGVSVLKKVYRELAHKSKGLVRKAILIPAKVPIIKLEMESPFDELEVDINCNNVPGIYNSHLLHYYARVDDRFPALCLLVKHWAINAGINDAMTGTFNSYSLILLVLHFLQCAVFPPVLPNLQALFPDQFNVSVDLNKLELFKELRPLPSFERNNSSVGELLIAFFDYYTNFDFTKKAISVASGNVFSRSSLPPSCLRYKIFIEEPFDLQNTARCVTRIENLKLIQNAFADARRALLCYETRGPTLSSINVR